MNDDKNHASSHTPFKKNYRRMKKIVLLLLAIVLSSNIFAQTEIYVIFTKVPGGTPGIRHSIIDNADMTDYRYPIHFYDMVNRQIKYFFSFEYSNPKTDPDNPILKKPTSFLNGKNCIDWDVVCPTLNTLAKAHAKHKEIIAYDKIYFIDRTQTANGTLTIVPIKPLIYKDIIGPDGKPL